VKIRFFRVANFNVSYVRITDIAPAKMLRQARTAGSLNTALQHETYAERRLWAVSAAE
jgi:hypothetical protein